ILQQKDNWEGLKNSTQSYREKKYDSNSSGATEVYEKGKMRLLSEEKEDSIPLTVSIEKAQIETEKAQIETAG
ncbi:hypothetical protein P7K49_024845, partial [Saguinus oedipus]